MLASSDYYMIVWLLVVNDINFSIAADLDRPDMPGARPTKHISIEFEIRWKFKTH